MLAYICVALNLFCSEHVLFLRLMSKEYFARYWLFDLTLLFIVSEISSEKAAV